MADKLVYCFLADTGKQTWPFLFNFCFLILLSRHLFNHFSKQTHSSRHQDFEADIFHQVFWEADIFKQMLHHYFIHLFVHLYCYYCMLLYFSLSQTQHTMRQSACSSDLMQKYSHWKFEKVRSLRCKKVCQKPKLYLKYGSQ